MNSNRSKILTLFCFIVVLAFNTQAQKDTVYNENVTINVGFNPIVTDANKININPSIFDTSFSQINMSFDKIDKGYATNLKFDSIKPAEVKGEPVLPIYHLNVKAGLGFAYSKQLGNGFVPLLQASYTSIRDRHLVWGADFYTKSIFGKEKDYGYAGYGQHDLNLWGKKISDNYATTGRFYYNNNAHYTYGSKAYTTDSVAEKQDYRIRWHNICLDLAYNKLMRDDSFDNKALFSINYTTSKLKTHELDLHFTLDGNKTVHWFGNTDQTLGLTFDYRHAFAKANGNWDYDNRPIIDDPIDSNYTIDPFVDWRLDDMNRLSNYSKSRALFNFSPYFIFDWNKFHFFASLAFIPKINGYNSFQILPTTTIDFQLIPSTLSFYGGFKCEAQLPTLYEKTKENPFLVPAVRLQDQANENLFAKLFLTLSPNAQISLEAGMMEMKNHAFFYNFIAMAKPMYNVMNIDYADAKRYYATFEASVNFVNSFKANLNVTYQNVKRDDDLTAAYQPKLLANLDLNYKYNDLLMFSLTPTFKSKQKAVLPHSEKEIKAMFDLNLEATYNYNSQWSFFIDLENLAFQKYQQYYNYPVYSFVALIGAKFRF